MNPKQIGLGTCSKHLQTPVLQAINQPGVNGVCFECQEEAKPKTGRTVVVTKETGDTKATSKTPDGTVEFEEVISGMPKPDAVQVRAAIAIGQLTILLTLEELYRPDIIKLLLERIYQGIDDMPPPPTIKEAKRIFGLQEKIEKLIKSMEK